MNHGIMAKNRSWRDRVLNRLRKQVEKFCYRHPRFGIPKLMLWLSIATAAVYVISLMDRSGVFQSLLLF